ncbi:MAG: hypothetical protein D6731_25570 [Planctomycetota bacterium]|nr:MAG: hypothetical protein D6731_25570 [Planctomycetota bacterium]
MKGEREALARGLSDSALLGLGSALGAALGFVSLRLLLTGLSEEEYGRYCLFLVVGGVGTVLLHWPAHAMLRLGAEDVEARGRLGRAYGSILALVVGSGLFAGAVAFAVRDAIASLVGAPVWHLALAFASLSALATLSYAVLQPAGKVGLRTLFPALARAVYAGLLALVVYGSGSLNLERAVWLCTASVVPAVVLPLVVVGGALDRPAFDRRFAARAFAFGWPLLLRNLGISGVLYVDVLLVQVFLGPAAAGRYDVAYRVAEQVVVFGMVLEYLVGPVLAVAAARGDEGPLQRFYRFLAPPLAWGWSLCAALLVVLAEPILSLLGAKSAAASAEVLRLLALTVSLRGAMSMEVAVFDAHLISRWPTAVFFAGFALNLVLDLALLSAGWGLTGPALATVLGFALQAICRALYLRRRLRVPALAPYASIVPVLLVFVVVWAGGALWGLTAWILLAASFPRLGRRLGLFPPEGRALLEQVRMPARLRRAVAALYAGDA